MEEKKLHCNFYTNIFCSSSEGSAWMQNTSLTNLQKCPPCGTCWPSQDTDSRHSVLTADMLKYFDISDGVVVSITFCSVSHLPQHTNSN